MSGESYILEQFHNAGILCPDKLGPAFYRYYELLLDWNSKINLTAITEFEDVVLKHFVDSLLPLTGRYVSRETFEKSCAGAVALPGAGVEEVLSRESDGVLLRDPYFSPIKDADESAAAGADSILDKEADASLPRGVNEGVAGSLDVISNIGADEGSSAGAFVSSVGSTSVDAVRNPAVTSVKRSDAESDGYASENTVRCLPAELDRDIDAGSASGVDLAADHATTFRAADQVAKPVSGMTFGSAFSESEAYSVQGTDSAGTPYSVEKIPFQRGTFAETRFSSVSVPSSNGCHSSKTRNFFESLAGKQNEKENVSRETFSVIDVGTGAGFPGIPLAAANPGWKVTLLDSLNKRINFLNEVKEELGLTNVQTVHSRAEDGAMRPAYREQYDIAVSRAVASLPVLLELCLPYVKVGGCFLAYKSGEIEAEAASAKNALKQLGGQIDRILYANLPGTDMGRSLVVVRKVKTTPKKYPRKAGTPSKNPL